MHVVLKLLVDYTFSTNIIESRFALKKFKISIATYIKIIDSYSNSHAREKEWEVFAKIRNKWKLPLYDWALTAFTWKP